MPAVQMIYRLKMRPAANGVKPAGIPWNRPEAYLFDGA